MTTLTAATPTAGGGMAPSQFARAGAPPAAGISGGDIFRIIRHRLVLIIILWLLSIGLTVGFTWFMGENYPKYRAEALVEVKSINPVNIMNPLERQMVRTDEMERLLNDQALIVQSPDVLQDALEDAKVRNTEWFTWATQEAEDKGEDLLDLLKETVWATPVRDTNYLRVAGVWRKPEEVPILVNTVVELYVAKINEFQKTGMRKTQEQLSKELATTTKLLDEAGQKIERFQAENDVLGRGDEPTERYLTLMALVTELEVEVLGRRAQWESLQGARPEDLPITSDLQAMLDQDPMILQQQRMLQDAEMNLEALKAQYGKNHRMVKMAQRNRDLLADQLADEQANKILRYKVEQIEQSHRNYLEAQDQLLRLKERLQQAAAEQRDKSSKYARYQRMLEERDLLRLHYEELLRQNEYVNIMLHQPKSVQIEMRSRAIPPIRRSSPRWEVWIPAGTMLGLMLSMGFAILLELADKTVRTPRDVLRNATIPVLGTIPTVDDDEIEIERVETASLDAPHSIIAEAFRTLRTNLFFSAPAEQQGVLMVTSPSGGNGKTTVAVNLGISIALSGRRVLLIDANFRRCALPRIFPNMRDEGLSNILIGQGRLEDLATGTSVPGLDVLCAGPAPPNPAELLGSSYLRDVVVDARSRYDQVIFDGPPVLLVSDAMVLSGAVDGVLVVCQYRVTSGGALQRMRSQLEAIGVRIFGAVLNKVETRAGGYFRKHYREFYEYQEAEETPSETSKRRNVETPKLGNVVGNVETPPGNVETGSETSKRRNVETEGGEGGVASGEERGASGEAVDLGDVGDVGDVSDVDIDENLDLGENEDLDAES